MDQNDRRGEETESTRGLEGDSGRYPTLGLRGLLREEVRPHERFAIIGGFGLFLLEIAAIIYPGLIHPVFPTGALLFFLYPFSRGIVTRRLMQLSITVLCLWLFLSLAGVLFPFIAAFVFAYLAAPLVTRLEMKGIPRWLTSLAVMLLIVGVYTIVGFVLIPAFVAQFDQLITTARGIFDEADQIFDRERMSRFFQRWGISEQKADELVARHVEPQIERGMESIIGWLGIFLQRILDVVEGIIGLILIPILSFYTTLDFHRFRAFVREKVLRNDPRYVYYLSNVDGIVSAYIRGILLTSSMVGSFAVAILSLLEVPYAIVLGVLTGLLNLIPTLGIFINIAIGIVIFALFPESFWYNTIVLTSTIFGLHALNAYVVEPRILGGRVGVHPVIVIASLFVFAYFMGFVGLLIAVPVTAIVTMFLREWYNRSLVGEIPKTETVTVGIVRPGAESARIDPGD